MVQTSGSGLRLKRRCDLEGARAGCFAAGQTTKDDGLPYGSKALSSTGCFAAYGGKAQSSTGCFAAWQTTKDDGLPHGGKALASTGCFAAGQTTKDDGLPYGSKAQSSTGCFAAWQTTKDDRLPHGGKALASTGCFAAGQTTKDDGLPYGGKAQSSAGCFAAWQTTKDDGLLPHGGKALASTGCFGAYGGKALAVVLFLLAALPLAGADSVTVIPGAVNGVLITRNGKTLAIYGDPREKGARAEKVLFTHHRRDVAWAGRALVAQGAEAVYPASEEQLFSGVPAFWAKYSQFHDYADQSSKILASPMPAGRSVRGGDHVLWNGLDIEVRDTPGYTRGAVSYLLTADGKRIACVGDLIYGDGRILDLFSLQDAIAATKEDGYHGYAARAAEVIASLRQIAEWKPDILIPARGPVIRDPQQAIERLTGRLQDVFASYFAVSALRHYRGDEKLNLQAQRILGDRRVDWMPMARSADPPSWIRVIGNTRVIVSSSGNALVVDCGNRRLLDGVKQLQRNGVFKTVEGIWVTHYHDDHTNFVQTASEELNAPVFASPEMQDILERPMAYRMPCLTSNPIRKVTTVAEGSSRRWHEFEFTYSYHPGQTLYHDGLLVKKDGGESVFFIGDSFTPSGIDDYCVLNRNLVEPEKGYEYCLNYVKRAKPDWLVNEHVNPAFHFSDTQIDTMLANLQKRRTQLAALFPWDDPNYGVDEQWARFYPYRSAAKSGERIELKVIVLNHSPVRREFVVTPHVPQGWVAGHGPYRIAAAARGSGEVVIPVTAGSASGGPAVITADVSYGQWELREWMEALVDVK